MATSVYTSLLINDYKRKAGEVIALRKELREAAKVVLAKERALAALETIIRDRKLDINMQSIKPIASYPKILNLKWGQLTVMILDCLREANGIPVGSEFISDYVIAKSGLAVQGREALIAVRTSVGKRLKGLAADGKVIRQHDKNTQSFGIWTLPSSE